MKIVLKFIFSKMFKWKVYIFILYLPGYWSNEKVLSCKMIANDEAGKYQLSSDLYLCWKQLDANIKHMNKIHSLAFHQFAIWPIKKMQSIKLTLL